MTSLAAKAGISERTVTDQNGKVALWLRGSRLPPKYGKAVVGEEDRALSKIENAQVLAGSVDAG